MILSFSFASIKKKKCFIVANGFFPLEYIFLHLFFPIVSSLIDSFSYYRMDSCFSHLFWTVWTFDTCMIQQTNFLTYDIEKILVSLNTPLNTIKIVTSEKTVTVPFHYDIFDKKIKAGTLNINIILREPGLMEYWFYYWQKHSGYLPWFSFIGWFADSKNIDLIIHFFSKIQFFF